MTTFRISHFHVGLILATALAVTAWPAAGQAYTPEQEQACSGDAFQFCGPEIPDVDRVTACMVANKSSFRRLAGRIQAGSRAQQAAAAPAGRPMASGRRRRASPAKVRQAQKAGKPAST